MKRKSNENSNFKNKKAAPTSQDSPQLQPPAQLEQPPIEESEVSSETLRHDEPERGPLNEPPVFIPSENWLPDDGKQIGAALRTEPVERLHSEAGGIVLNSTVPTYRSQITTALPVDPDEQANILKTPPDSSFLPQLSPSPVIPAEETVPTDALSNMPTADQENNGTFPIEHDDLTTVDDIDYPLGRSSLPLDNLFTEEHGDTPEPDAGAIRISEGQSIDDVVNAVLQRPHIACRVPLDLIDFYPRNRKLFNQVSLEELAASIAQVDVINDIILRNLPNGRYELVAGERRVRASKIAGKVDIPAKIYDMSDAEARQVRVSENGHREDYHPMEEAIAIGEMKEDFPSIELIASRLGKPASYVLGRIKLLSLVPDAQEIFLADAIGIRDAQELAAFEDDVQQVFITAHLSGWKKGKKFTDLKWEFDKLKGSLKNPPFDIKDPNLSPDMGACTRCPFNSGCQQSLFAELAEDPVCRKLTCYQLKTDKQLVKNVTHSVNKHKPMAIVSVMPLSEQQRALIKEIPGTEGLEFVLEQTVFEVKKPQQPKQDQFKDTSSKSAKKAFEEQYIHYKEAVTYQENAIKNRKIFRSILIQRNGKVEGYMFTRDSKASSTGQSGKVGLIQDDIKAGTVTTKQLSDELQRLRTNEEISAKKDAAEVAENIHAALSVQVEAKEISIPHTPIDTAIQRWMLFERLHYSDQREIVKKLFGEDSGNLSLEDFMKRLHELTDDQVSLLSRMVFLSINDTKKPGTMGGYFSTQLAEAIGIDVSKIQEERAQKSEERKKKFKKSESDLLKRIKQKSKKTAGKIPKKVEIQD